MKTMPSYLDFDPLSSVDARIAGKISELYHSKEINYNPPRKYVFTLDGYELLGAVRSPKAKWGSIFTDSDGTINARDSDDPTVVWIKKLAEEYPALERLLPKLFACMKDVWRKRNIYEPTQRFAIIMYKAGVRERHMKAAADEAPKDVKLVPRTLDAHSELRDNMLYHIGLVSGGWEYMTKNVGELLLSLPRNQCFGSEIPFYPDGRLRGTMIPCLDANKSLARDKFHNEVGCSNDFSIIIDNDPELEYKSAITHGTNLNIFVDFGPSSGLPEDLKDQLRKKGDAKGFYKFPGVISVFLPEARDDAYRIVRPIRVQEALKITLAMYTKHGYRTMLNYLDKYEETYETCRTTTGSEFAAALENFLDLSTKIIRMSYPPMDVPKVKPHLDNAASEISEESSRENADKIFEFIEANRPELKGRRGWREDILDLWNEIEPMTNFRR